MKKLPIYLFVILLLSISVIAETHYLNDGTFSTWTNSTTLQYWNFLTIMSPETPPNLVQDSTYYTSANYSVQIVSNENGTSGVLQQVRTGITDENLELCVNVKAMGIIVIANNDLTTTADLVWSVVNQSWVSTDYLGGKEGPGIGVYLTSNYVNFTELCLTFPTPTTDNVSILFASASPGMITNFDDADLKTYTAPIVTPSTIYDMCKNDAVRPNEICTLMSPTLSCTNYTYQIYNSTSNIENGNLTVFNLTSNIYYLNFNQSVGTYFVKLCDGSTREIRVENMDNGAGIAVAIFVFLITGGIVFLGIWGRFSKHELLNSILKRSCYVLACFTLMLDAAIMSTIVTSSGLDLSQEMFFLMWVFGTLGFIMMMYMGVKSLLDVLKQYKINKRNKRMGE